MIDKPLFEDLKALKKMKGLAVAWMREKDWPKWLEIDPGFQPDYAHWLRRVEEAYTRYQTAGVPIVKMVIQPEEFLAWTRANGRGIGSTDRAGFAAWKMMQDEQRSKLH